ncbi:hypothetical protein Purlil1_13 [Purpureocillium lilacinum]|uniref:Uncharacterized protein n=1 Tax=Purpureocillium lilacinum TaxID=33203 RepID=A0ABR0CGH0_PURLI|nr:hypothetical protein Purlil1_13 [Purpureocillium lilacinum]
MLACFEPLAYSISVVLSWLFRRVPSKRASCLVIGDLGVGKTSLISILMDEEPDVHYMPTVEVQRHDPPGRGYSLIEVPGSLPDAEIPRIQTASDHDLIIFVFRPDKILTGHYYRRFWTTPPPVPAIVVEVSPGRAAGSSGERRECQLWGRRCDYFPITMRDPTSLQKLAVYLDRHALSFCGPKSAIGNAPGSAVA